jgi:hypothetical protein
MLPLALVLALLIGCGGKTPNGGDEATGKDGSKGPKKAVTPELAVENMLAASKAGDLKGVLAQLAEGPRRVAEAVIDNHEAKSSFETALNYKVGFAPRKGPAEPDPKDVLLSVVRMEILKKDDAGSGKVKMSVKSTKVLDGKKETKTIELGAVKEGDVWKLVPADMPADTKQIAALLGQIAKVTAAYRKVTKEIADGKLKNRDEANKALAEANKGLAEELKGAK